MTKNATGFAVFAHGRPPYIAVIKALVVKNIPNTADISESGKSSFAHGVFYDANAVQAKIPEKLSEEDKRTAVREFAIICDSRQYFWRHTFAFRAPPFQCSMPISSKAAH
jgi:hypothetical protein